MLVYIPTTDDEPPIYYIVIGAELLAILQPRDQRYRENFAKNHQSDGKKPGVGVVSVYQDELPINAQGAWRKIAATLEQ